MAFNVTFKILWSRNGAPISNGILVYECREANGRPIYPDQLNENGVATTSWHDSWSGDTVKVFCHTDGKNYGTPRYVHTVTLKPRENFVLWPD